MIDKEQNKAAGNFTEAYVTAKDQVEKSVKLADHFMEKARQFSKSAEEWRRSTIVVAVFNAVVAVVQCIWLIKMYGWMHGILAAMCIGFIVNCVYNLLIREVPD